MIAARLINSDATINNFRQIGSISFLNGTQFVINLQLYNTELNNRAVFNSTDSILIRLQRLDGSTALPLTGTALEGDVAGETITDRSIYSFLVSANDNSETSTGMAGGNIIFEITRSSGIIHKGVLFNALAREITDGSC